MFNTNNTVAVVVTRIHMFPGTPTVSILDSHNSRRGTLSGLLICGTVTETF